VDFEAISENCPKGTVRLYERNPKFRLLVTMGIEDNFALEDPIDIGEVPK
jgi:hypothetical protein